MLNRNERAAIILALVERLSKENHFCGEISVQKLLYVMEHLLQVPLGVDFVFYKHGPFSFDLEQQLCELWGEELLVVVPTVHAQGASLRATDQGLRFSSQYSESLRRHYDDISFVCRHLGPLTCAELEKIATSLYVVLEMPSDASISERVERSLEYIPHLKRDEAMKAFEMLDALNEPVKNRKLVAIH